MYKKFISAFHMMNILLQALYSLALPIGIGALASYLLTKQVDAPGWTWAVLMLIGTFTGLYSMVRYILTATKGIEQMKKLNAEAEAERQAKEEMQKRLKNEFTNKNDKGEI